MESPKRLFHKEILDLLGRTVLVKTKSGVTYQGVMKGFDSETLTLALSNVLTDKGKKYYRVFITGHEVSEIIQLELPLNMEELAKKIAEVFKGDLVRYDKESGIIHVMHDQIRVTEEGVTGSGPAYERVKKIYDDFIKEKRG